MDFVIESINNFRSDIKTFSNDLLSQMLDNFQVDETDQLKCSMEFKNINKKIEIEQQIFQILTENLKKFASIMVNSAPYEQVQLEDTLEFSENSLPDNQQIRRIKYKIDMKNDLNDLDFQKEIQYYILINELISLQNFLDYQDSGFEMNIRNPSVNQEPFIFDPSNLKIKQNLISEDDNVYELLIRFNKAEKLDVSNVTQNIQQSIMSEKKKQKNTNNKYQKYDRFQFEKPKIINISLQIVDQLIKQMDHDNDLKISQGDIKKFCEEHYLDLDEEIIEKMFRDAAKERAQVNRDQESIYKNPLDRLEIEQAVRLRNRRTEEGWEQVEKSYRKYWLLFFKILQLGVDEENKDKKPMIHPLSDIHSMNHKNYQEQKQKQNRPLTTTTFSQTLPLKMPTIAKSIRPEGGLTFKSSKGINRIANEEVIYQSQKEVADDSSRLFMKVVNNRFEKNEMDGNGVSFDTQDYYKEVLRLAANPISYNTHNPITKFVPPRRYKQGRQSAFQPMESNYSQESTSNLPLRLSAVFKIHQEYKPQTIQKPSMINYNMTSNLHQRISSQRREQKNKEALHQARYNPNQQTSSPLTFQASFNSQQCIAIKKKQATKDCLNHEEYQDPLIPNFRPDIHTLDNRPVFKISNSPLKDKYVYLRDQEDSSLPPSNNNNNPTNNRSTWNSFYKKADLHTEFISHKYPDGLKKGCYEEPAQQLNNLLRDPINVPQQFQLFHRPLNCEDKNKYFGENYSKLTVINKFEQSSP